MGDKAAFYEDVEKRLKAAEDRIAFFERATMSWKQEEQEWHATNATLRAENERLREVLCPFARTAKHIPVHWDTYLIDEASDLWSCRSTSFRFNLAPGSKAKGEE